MGVSYKFHMSKNLRRILSWLFTILLLPVVGEFAVKLGEQNGLYNDPNGKLTQAMTAVTQSAFYWPLVAFFFGLFCGAWSHWLAIRFDRKKADSQPPEPISKRALLRLRFPAHASMPTAIYSDNVEYWCVTWSNGASLGFGPQQTLSVATSRTIVVQFEHAVDYRQLSVSSPNDERLSWQPALQTPKLIVILLPQGAPAGVVEISTSQ
ncbi:hypothetical protein GGQ73_003173 [Rhizobium skierniewicense]|uniref:Uncharacterized protein n=1 Tax=Rhizobium skierniewicense TaxID=984260 RepID=A0A7W6CCA0_9HYPH|nr:hypothetical protein [Rhizobium skierniewicense]MBB3947207.1 hypothetical protein [Rhizobium skierniewicense]